MRGQKFNHGSIVEESEKAGETDKGVQELDHAEDDHGRTKSGTGVLHRQGQHYSGHKSIHRNELSEVYGDKGSIL